MKKLILLSGVMLAVCVLSSVDAGTIRTKDRVSANGKHVHSHAHAVGRVRSASCSGVGSYRLRLAAPSCAGSASAARTQIYVIP